MKILAKLTAVAVFFAVFRSVCEKKESSFGTTSITMAGKAHRLSEALYSGALVNLLSSLLYFIQLLNTGRRRCFSTEFRD